MSRLRKISLSFFLICFLTVQLKLTLFGGFLWPFSSHRLFARMPEMNKQTLQAVVEDANGDIQSVHPGRVIPIEFCRCVGLVRNIFTNGSDFQKEQLQKYLLERLNQKPWWAFDEMYPSVKSPTEAAFVSLKFETHELDFTSYSYSTSLPVKQKQHLYP